MIEKKKTETVINILKKWCWVGHIPEKIVSDNGKESVSKGFKEFCESMGIVHEKIGVESYRSNGRVERIIGTIREGLVKLGEIRLEEKIKLIVDSYNKTYHIGIKYMPKKALKANYNAVIENSKDRKYHSIFRKNNNETLSKGQEVLIRSNENIKKENKGRFLEKIFSKNSLFSTNK